MISSSLREEWARIPIARIEDLSDAVYDAGLEATQMSADRLAGSLAFAESRGMVFGSGWIDGTVALNGPLSLDKITFGFGWDVRPGTWHWMRPVSTGSLGVFLPGDEHDSRYTPGSLYSTLTIDADRLEEEAAQEDMVLDRRALGGTGFHGRLMPDALVTTGKRGFERVHGGLPAQPFDMALGDFMLRTATHHFGRPPLCHNRAANLDMHARIVRRARAYIRDHLDCPIPIDNVAAAARTSRRTLFRAFAAMLDDTPYTYVRRLRLHRIRQDIASEAERACSIAIIANSWGMSDLGRMAAWYRELFGELPSETLTRARDAGLERKPAILARSV